MRTASSSALATAVAAAPPAASTLTAANCEPPVNTSSDIASACASVSPAMTASTPNEIPYTPVATPMPSASAA